MDVGDMGGVGQALAGSDDGRDDGRECDFDAAAIRYEQDAVRSSVRGG